MKQLIDYDVTSVVMGGGAGSRLFPLTRERAKPAVPLGGKFRLIDVPISNCLNSGLMRIYILTQFNSTPLHRHISGSYHFDRFSRGFVEILAAQQSPRHTAVASWYQGTADAVRKNLERFREAGGKDVLILSGDQIYRMDFQEILATHRGRGGTPHADVTIGAVLVSREKARSLGVLRVDHEGSVEAFVEKPGSSDELYKGLEASPALLSEFGMDAGDGPWYLGNMGIYVFDRQILEAALDSEAADFGKEVLPSLLGKVKVRAHLFRGYWEDIGTIRTFHRANLELAREDAQFDFYIEKKPIYTRARLLPASRLQDVRVKTSLICDGCLVREASIDNSLIGLRSVIGKGCLIRSTYVMGGDWYETDEDRARNRREGKPNIGIGDGCIIENAIIDKDARVGRGVKIINREGHENYTDSHVVIRDGIAVVPRSGFVPDGYEI
ncbi:MAG: glucose-1-phosphate adenylyltransferase [Planctomycetes bacterium]|nr:glucose-1-phosphate adenylyltransferase [Planctomycetota bacterium]